MENLTKMQLLDLIVSTTEEIVSTIEIIVENGGNYSTYRLDEVLTDSVEAKKIKWLGENITSRMKQVKKEIFTRHLSNLKAYALEMEELKTRTVENRRQLEEALLSIRMEAEAEAIQVEEMEAEEMEAEEMEKPKKEVPVKCKGVVIMGEQRRFCGKEGTNHTFIPVKTKNHGTIYMCENCYNKEFGYSRENSLKVNKPKKHGFTFSFEMELTAHHDAFVRMLQYNNFLPTSDSTVEIEYKSPIYQSLNGIRKLFRSMSQELSDDYFDYRAGTHCNIGQTEYINATTIEWLRRFYHSLFVPVSRWLQLNPVASVELYGREIGGWAMPINENTSPYEHKNFINLEHDTHIEFRQCKYINENQYIDCVQLNTRIVTAIINNFIKSFNDTDFDTRRYKNITEYRRHRAKVTASRIIKVLEKECTVKGIPFTSL